ERRPARGQATTAAWYPLPLARASEPGPGWSTATTGRRCAPPRRRTPSTAPRTVVTSTLPPAGSRQSSTPTTATATTTADPAPCTSGSSPAWASGLTPRRSGGHGATTATASSTTTTTASQDSPCWTSNRQTQAVGRSPLPGVILIVVFALDGAESPRRG